VIIAESDFNGLFEGKDASQWLVVQNLVVGLKVIWKIGIPNCVYCKAGNETPQIVHDGRITVGHSAFVNHCQHPEQT
jgi:hypothetical protein